MQYGTKKTHGNLNKETVNVESIWKQNPLNSWYERNLKCKNSVNTQMEEIRSVLHFIIQMIPNGSRVLPLSLDEVCCSSFRALSLLDLMSSSGISVIRRVIISKKMFWDCGGFRDIRWVVNSVADPGEGPAPLIFRQNWGPKGKKKFLETPPPPLSKGLDDWGPTPLSSSSGSGNATGLRVRWNGL